MNADKFPFFFRKLMETGQKYETRNRHRLSDLIHSIWTFRLRGVSKNSRMVRQLPLISAPISFLTKNKFILLFLRKL